MGNDPTTGRPYGDHGTSEQAINWALDGRNHDNDAYNQIAFLTAWREGDAFGEWPEFYTWLAAQPVSA